MLTKGRLEEINPHVLEFLKERYCVLEEDIRFVPSIGSDALEVFSQMPNSDITNWFYVGSEVELLEQLKRED
jgi:hypothetical protein